MSQPGITDRLVRAQRQILVEVRGQVWELQAEAANLSSEQLQAGDGEGARVLADRSGAFSDVVRLIDEKLKELS